jgi:DnaJ-class molecular chaperone
MASPDAHDPQRCTACRGTGRVISGLGGDPHEVPCPWCEGTGRFIPGHDAQAARMGGETA